MKRCPYCGADIPDGASLCRFCHRSLIAEPITEGPKPVLSFLMAVVLLSLFSLTGVLLVDLLPYFRYTLWVYAAVVIFLISILAARGRYEYPTGRQYLYTLLITLVPFIGTAYGLFYAGKHMAYFRSSRYAQSVLLLVVLILVFLTKVDQDYWNRTLALSDMTPTPAPTLTAKPSHTPTATLQPNPTATLPPTFPPSPTAPTMDCILYSDLTPERLNEEFLSEPHCVYGEYLEYYQRSDGTWVLVFSEDPGSFQVWSNPRPMDYYLQTIDDRCVMVTGDLQSNGVRPFIILGSQSLLKGCK